MYAQIHKLKQKKEKWKKLGLTGNQSKSVIQRRIGYEFETRAPIEVFKYKKWEDAKDKTVLLKELNWRGETDGKNAEIITNPIALGLIESTTNTIGSTLSFYQKEWEKARENKKGYYYADKEFRISTESNKDVWAGKPQLTVGIPLKNVKKFFQIMNDLKVPAFEEYWQKHVDNKKLDEEKRKVAEKMRDHSFLRGEKQIHLTKMLDKFSKDNDNLESLMMLMSTYIGWYSEYKQSPGSYIKGSLPIMNRTDFASMYQLLNNDDKLTFRKWANSFEEDPLLKSPAPDVEENYPNGIPMGIVDTESLRNPPSIKEWVMGVAGFVKEEGKYEYKNEPKDLMTKWGGTDAAIGLIKVDAEDEDKVVFEIRSFASMNIPFNIWKKGLKQILESIRDVLD